MCISWGDWYSKYVTVLLEYSLSVIVQLFARKNMSTLQRCGHVTHLDSLRKVLDSTVLVCFDSTSLIWDYSISLRTLLS